MKFLKTLILAIIILIIIIIGGYKFLTLPVGDDITELEITIPLGSSTDSIGKILKENNLIKSKTVFKIYVKLNNVSDFQAGTYYLKQSMSMKEICQMLQTGVMYDPNQITITYLEGKPFWWLAKTISEKTNNTEDEVYLLLEDEEYIDSLIDKYWFVTEDIKDKNVYYSLEGYLFPDTYAIQNKDVTVEEIFEKMLDQMEKILEPYKEEIQNSEYSIHELLSIASIIEMESINTDDRKDVGSVIYNRLNSNMSIQSDVTTYYSFKIDMGERDLYQKEIDTYNPYNTRGPNMSGKLPVGPISSVSKSSIEAAIEPTDTNYLFFVADKNGKLYFSTTNSEHVEIINKLMSEGLWYEYEED